MMDMRYRHIGPLFLTCCLLLAAVPAHATFPAEFKTEGKCQFDGCELDGVTLTDEGKIILSVELEKTADLAALQVWALAADKSGAFYAGTGDEGKLYVLRQGAEPKVLYDSEEQQVHSVLVDNKDRLYIGTGPSGIVLTIDRASGSATKLFETGEKYIWALASGPEGEIYAGTGPNGKVFKITGPGRGEAILELGAPNITALSYDVPGKRLLVGTSSGVVYSFTGSGKPKAHLEAKGMEIRTILVDGAELFVLAMASGKGAPIPMAEPPSASEPPDVSSMPEALQAAMSAAMSKRNSSSPTAKAEGRASTPSVVKSAVYRIHSDGRVERTFTTENGSLFCMDWQDGNLLAFGYREKEGVVVRMNKNGDADLLRAMEGAKFISACRIPGGGLALGTSEAARVFQLRPTQMQLEGSLVSEIQDASSRARWGKVSWDATDESGAEVCLFTRSGDASKVDESWSDWAGPLKDKNGSECLSPEAQYIQYKAVLSKSKSASSPSLEKVVIPYIQINVPPSVDQITIHDAGEDLSSIIRSAKEPGLAAKYENLKLLDRFSDVDKAHLLRAITWQASDYNGDDLDYSVFLKPRDGVWQPLTAETELTFAVIDTSVLADGEYLVKVSACDGLSNPASDKLCSEEESDKFVVDNTAPVVKFASVKRLSDGSFQISGKITDEMSNVAAAAFAVDLGRFNVMRPQDGILDSKEEEFEIKTPVLDAGGHFVAIRVEDACGNITVARKELSK
ncbi:MAG: hypothetical protein JW759_07555 [Candidatus Coatesbacteria bacterium]|nr:hypothetical protein [Candidatus Coatesbacteria bacterium]